MADRNRRGGLPATLARWLAVLPTREIPGDLTCGETMEVPAVAAKFVLKKSSNGKFHFNLHATNGQVIATSEMYESKAAAVNGIDSVKKNAPAADVDDQTAN